MTRRIEPHVTTWRIPLNSNMTAEKVPDISRRPDELTLSDVKESDDQLQNHNAPPRTSLALSVPEFEALQRGYWRGSWRGSWSDLQGSRGLGRCGFRFP